MVDSTTPETFLQTIYNLYNLDSSQFEISQTQIKTTNGLNKIPGMLTVFEKDSEQIKTHLSIRDIFFHLTNKNAKPIVGQDFTNGNFSGGQMLGLEFVDCDFSGSRINKANLSNSIFINCEFSRVDFSRARFGDTRFENCSFQLAKLTEVFGGGAVFDRCNFLMCDLWQATISVDSFKECWGTDELKSDLDYRA